MAAVEIILAETWLYSTLANDVTLTTLINKRVFSLQPPQGVAFPFIAYQLQAGNDIATMNNKRVMAELVYQVKVIGQTPSPLDLAPIFQQLDALIHNKVNQQVTGGTIYSCVREQSFVQAETDKGIEYRHLGGIYRLEVQAT